MRSVMEVNIRIQMIPDEVMFTSNKKRVRVISSKTAGGL
jgi:hypothetical protein